MAIAHYLAMTAAEMASATSLPPNTAWMACHFSPYSTGLGNLPKRLPKGSLLILNDRTPIHRHDPERVSAELNAAILRLECGGLLLDFQNPVSNESADLARFVARNAPCPVGISPEYDWENAAVFLPPVPTDVSLNDYLAPWKNRVVWLEAALDGQTIRLTREGAVVSEYHREALPCLEDTSLHCHYRIEDTGQTVLFHLWRTPEDLRSLLEEAEPLGVQNAIGLYQELQGKI